MGYTYLSITDLSARTNTGTLDRVCLPFVSSLTHRNRTAFESMFEEARLRSEGAARRLTPDARKGVPHAL